jgi:hypothetical protein
MKLHLLALTCAVLIVYSAPGYAEEKSLGPATISLDLSAISGQLEAKDPIQGFHNSHECKFDYTLYPAAISGSEGTVALELYHLAKPLEMTADLLEHCIERSMLMPFDGQAQPYSIDGCTSVLVEGYADKGESQPMYVVALGSQNGDACLVVSSSLPWEISEEIFQSIRLSI